MISPIAKDRQPEAIDRLIELYAATNQPDEVQKWRAEQAGFGYTEVATLLHHHSAPIVLPGDLF